MEIGGPKRTAVKNALIDNHAGVSSIVSDLIEPEWLIVSVFVSDHQDGQLVLKIRFRGYKPQLNILR